MADGISPPVFAPDGTAYVWTRGSRGAQLVALDSSGNVKPGWPVELLVHDRWWPPTPVVAADGSVLVGEDGEPDVGGVTLHRLGAGGRELPGWPFPVASPATCHEPVLAPDGVTYLACGSGDGNKDLLYAIDPDGRARRGWPVAIEGLIRWQSHLRIGPDGTVFVSSGPEGPAEAPRLSALAPDGRRLPGWPISLSPQLGDYLLGPDGTVVVWWYDPLPGAICGDASRTLYAVLGVDGRPLPGWPLGAKGLSSAPVVGDDGAVYYVTEAGEAFAHDRGGDVRPGWPVHVGVGYDGPCTPASPYLRPDGTLYFHGEEITAMSPDGRPRTGWPVRPAGSLGPVSSCIMDGPSRPRLAFGPDGTTYLAVFHEDPAESWADVLALDRNGRVSPGWPHRLPLRLGGGLAVVSSLDVSPGGKLYVTLLTCAETPDMLVVLDGDGSAAP